MSVIDLNLNPTKRELRWFAGLLIVFFAVVSYWMSQKDGFTELATTLLLATTVLGVVGLIAPGLIRPVYVVWMIAVFPIGWTVSHLLLAAIFYLVITPLAVMMKLIGRDPMHRSFDKSAASYWVPRNRNRDSKQYFRQF